MVQNNKHRLFKFPDIKYNIIFHHLNIHDNSYHILLHIIFNIQMQQNIHNCLYIRQHGFHNQYKHIFLLNCKTNTLYYQKTISDIHKGNLRNQCKYVYYLNPYTIYDRFLYSYLHNFHNFKYNIYNLMLMVYKLNNQDNQELFVVHNHQYSNHFLIIMYILLMLKIMYQLHTYHNIQHHLFYTTYIFSSLLKHLMIYNSYLGHKPYF